MSHGYDKTRPIPRSGFAPKRANSSLKAGSVAGFGRITHEIQTDKTEVKTDADLTDGLLFSLENMIKGTISHDQAAHTETGDRVLKEVSPSCPPIRSRR